MRTSTSLRRLVAGGASLLAAGSLIATGVGLGVGTAGASKTKASCGASATKCYSVSVAPTAVTAGARQEFSITVTNQGTPQSLGSIRVTVPAGFTVAQATTTAATPAATTVTSTSAEFDSLAIAPHSSRTLHLVATAPCKGGSYAFSTQGKQANQFNSTTGNNFVLTKTGSSLSVSVTGTCTIQFTDQPRGTTVGTRITNTFDTPTGTPVEVGVYSVSAGGTATLLSTFVGTITLSLLGGPSGAVLSGTTTVDHPTGGPATFTFADLDIAQAGAGYQLVAKSNALPAATPRDSTKFSIYDTLKSCTTATHVKHCAGTAKDGTLTLSSVATTTTSTAQYLGLGFGNVPGFTSCGSYKFGLAGTDTTNFDVLQATGTPTKRFTSWVVSVEIQKAALKPGRTSPNSWQVCLASTTRFTTATGTKPTTDPTLTVSGTTYYYGLLPSCPSKTATASSTSAPCVLSTKKDSAGDVVITFLSTGDTYGRF